MSNPLLPPENSNGDETCKKHYADPDPESVLIMSEGNRSAHSENVGNDGHWEEYR